MFLEICGKFFSSRMGQNLFLFLLLFPLFSAAAFLYFQYSYFQNIEEEFRFTKEKAKKVYEKKIRKERFLDRYSQTDPFYLDRKIESFPLLQKEREQIKNLLEHPALSHKGALLQRMQFLTSEKNRITFTEESIRNTDRIKETEEKQRFPVEMDEADLKKLLCLLEDLPVDSFEEKECHPQFLIKDFRLQKKQTPLHTEVLEVEMELLKREFL